MKLLLVRAMAETHPYSHFIRALHAALSELGHEARITDQSVHVSQGAAPTEFFAEELRAGRFDAVVSFSSFFGAVTLFQESLYDAWGIKFVGWQVDHPIYAPHSLFRTLRNRYAVYANHNHLRYAQAVKLPGRGMTLLPGGHAPSRGLPDFAAREHAVVVAATFNGEPQTPWQQLPDSPGKRLLEGVIRRLLRDREASLLDAFNDTAAKLKLGARLGADPGFDEQMRNFLRAPLTYVRNHDRIAIIRAIADAGLPLTICGAGWEACLGERPNVRYLPPVAFDALPQVYGNARVVLNLNAGNGGCERAVDAALAGAAVVSDYSQQLQGLLKEGVGFFNRAKPESVAKAAGDLLEGSAGETAGQTGHDRVASFGLWRHRAQQLVDYLAT